VLVALAACKGTKKGESEQPAKPADGDKTAQAPTPIDAAPVPVSIDAAPKPAARTEPVVFFRTWSKNVLVPLACVKDGELQDTETCLDLIPEGAEVGFASGSSGTLGKRKELECSADAGSTVGRVVSAKDIGDWAVWPASARSLVTETKAGPADVAEDVRARLAKAADVEPAELKIDRALVLDLDGDGTTEALYATTEGEDLGGLYLVSGDQIKNIGSSLSVMASLDLRGGGHHEVWLRDQSTQAEGTYQWDGKRLDQIGSWGCSNEMP